jgi:hypothetical protein
MANIYLSLKVKRKKYPRSKKCVNFEKKFLDQLIFVRLTWISVNGFADMTGIKSATKHILELPSRHVVSGLSQKYSGILHCPKQRYDSAVRLGSVSQRAQ